MKLKRLLELICLISAVLTLAGFFSMHLLSRPGQQEEHYAQLENQLTREADSEMKAIDAGADFDSHINAANSKRSEANRFTDLRDDLMMARTNRSSTISLLTLSFGATWFVSLFALFAVNLSQRRTLPSPSL